MLCSVKRCMDRDLIITSPQEALQTLRCIIFNIEYRVYKAYGMENITQDTIETLSEGLSSEEKAAAIKEASESTDWVYQYIKIYDSVRPHQSLDYLTLDEAYEKGCSPIQENDKNKNKVA